MEPIFNLNRRVKKYSFIDVKLAQGVAIFLTLVIVKLVPEILDINVWWFIAAWAICVIKPFYVFWIKKQPHDERK